MHSRTAPIKTTHERSEAWSLLTPTSLFAVWGRGLGRGTGHLVGVWASGLWAWVCSGLASCWWNLWAHHRLLSDPRSRALLTFFLGVCPCSGPADTRRCAHNIVCCSIKFNISYLLLAMHMLVVAVVSKLCFCLFFFSRWWSRFSVFFLSLSLFFSIFSPFPLLTFSPPLLFLLLFLFCPPVLSGLIVKTQNKNKQTIYLLSFILQNKQTIIVQLT